MVSSLKALLESLNRVPGSTRASCGAERDLRRSTEGRSFPINESITCLRCWTSGAHALAIIRFRHVVAVLAIDGLSRIDKTYRCDEAARRNHISRLSGVWQVGAVSSYGFLEAGANNGCWRRNDVVGPAKLDETATLQDHGGRIAGRMSQLLGQYLPAISIAFNGAAKGQNPSPCDYREVLLLAGALPGKR